MTVITEPLVSTRAHEVQETSTGLGLVHSHGRFVLVGAAATMTVADFDFMVKHTEGFVQIALHEATCDRLLIPEAAPTLRDRSSASFGQCVAVDAVAGVTTGISGADRAQTARLLVQTSSQPGDFTRPGHLVPVRVDPAALEQNETVAAVALAVSSRIAPTEPGAVFAELVGLTDETGGATLADALFFATSHGLPLHRAG
ncbi:3,4-dihydroxy-2-butanone-4-phosphate synthase [Gordonia terrae]